MSANLRLINDSFSFITSSWVQHDGNLSNKDLVPAQALINFQLQSEVHPSKMKAEFFSDLLLDLRNLDIGLLNARRDVNIILYLTSAHVVWCKNPIRLSFETEVIYSEFFFFQGDTFTGTMSIILGRKHGDYIWKKCQKMKLNHIVSLGFFPYSRGKTALLRKLLPAEGISFHNSVVVRHIWNGVHEKKRCA